MGGLNDEAPLNLSEKPLAFWERQVRLLLVRPEFITPVFYRTSTSRLAVRTVLR